MFVQLTLLHHPDSYYSVAARLSKEIENSYYPNQYSNLSNSWHTTKQQVQKSGSRLMEK